MGFQSTPAGFPTGDDWIVMAGGLSEMFQSTPAGFPTGDTRRRGCRRAQSGFNPHLPVSQQVTRHGRAGRLCHRFQSTPAGFPTGDGSASAPPAGRGGFQSTPAGFPTGDGWSARCPARIRSFNPHLPVSQQVTWRSASVSPPVNWFQSTPAGFPTGDCQIARPLAAARCVSIHTCRFPNR